MQPFPRQEGLTQGHLLLINLEESIMQSRNSIGLRSVTLVAGLSILASVATANSARDPFIPRVINSSTIPANGDLNPYGVAFVPKGFPVGGAIKTGDVLVSNFNSSTNLQGTGTTIVQFTPRGSLAPPGMAVTFFSSHLPGLSTALGVLRGGFVLVGSVPTTDGTSATVGQGAIQVIDRHGTLIQTWTDPVFLDGPWDLTVDDQGTEAHVFVSNVLSGTISRLDVSISSNGVTLLHKTMVASGYKHVTDPVALVLGPTGLAFDSANDTLYVASTADNAIYKVPLASHRSAPAILGDVVFMNQHLRGPLGLRFAPNRHLLTANSDAVNGDPLHPSGIVEFTKTGRFVREYNVDASQGGAFGIDTVMGEHREFNYAAIDDVTNNLSVYRLPVEEE